MFVISVQFELFTHRKSTSYKSNSFIDHVTVIVRFSKNAEIRENFYISHNFFFEKLRLKTERLPPYLSKLLCLPYRIKIDPRQIEFCEVYNLHLTSTDYISLKKIISYRCCKSNLYWNIIHS